MNVPPATARDLCDPLYHAAKGTPLFDFDPAWWQDIVVHHQQTLGDIVDGDADMAPMNEQEGMWKPQEAMQEAIVAIGSSTSDPAIASWAQLPTRSEFVAVPCAPLPARSRRSWPVAQVDVIRTDVPSSSLQDPCSLESASSLSYSSSALHSPTSPGSRGSKRLTTDETSWHDSPSAKRRRVQHDSYPASSSSAFPKQCRFFIDDGSADEEQEEHEGTWEIVQGPWWNGSDTELADGWGRWKSSAAMMGPTTSLFPDPRWPVQVHRGGEDFQDQDVPQNARIVCVRAMPPLREPVPKLPRRAVDGAIRILEESARIRSRA